MNNLYLSNRLRPTRFAFLADPNDKKQLLEIFQTNTCLWGGKYNPILPLYKRLPEKWGNRIQKSKVDTTQVVLSQYIDFFEPDFLVVSDSVHNLNFDRNRILRIEDILSKSHVRFGGYGTQTHLIYDHLHKSRFQFVSKNQLPIISTKCINERDRLFDACVFGTFSKHNDYTYFQTMYENIFEPRVISLDSPFLERLNNHNFLTPFDVGLFGIDEIHHDYHFPQIFVMDGESGLDLIDFWNLRSIYRKIIPFPYKSFEDPVNALRNIVSDLQGVVPGNTFGMQICPNVLFSRSIPLQYSEQLYSQLCLSCKQQKSVQSWFPAFWKNPNTPYGQYSKVVLQANYRSSSVSVDKKNSVEFESLYPDFIDTIGAKFACANVIKINHGPSDFNVPTAYPVDCKDSSFLRFTIGFDPIVSTSEGLITFPNHSGETHFWTLSDGAMVLQNWFLKNNIKISPSSAGRSTEQILRILPGSAALGSIRFKGVIEQLNKMASSLTRSENLDAFKSNIKKASKTGKNICHPLKNLISCGVVKLGQEVKCNHCDYWNWFPLNNLDESIQCDRCRRDYNFPIHYPDNKDFSYWAYRVLGPFAIPNYAEGGYAAALSIGFFRDILASESNDKFLWSQGLNFVFPSDKNQKIGEYETDFILLFQQTKNYESFTAPIMLFGEAKSFGKNRINHIEINRLKTFAKKFPGSGIVISMLREARDLSKKELNLLRKLALWGKKYDATIEQMLAPVILLTADELLAHGLTARTNVFGGIQPYGPSKIHALATYTQNKYLGISPNEGCR